MWHLPSSMNFNEETYPQPHKFDPERFLSADRKTCVVSSASSAAFSFGKRYLCPASFTPSPVSDYDYSFQQEMSWSVSGRCRAILHRCKRPQMLHHQVTTRGGFTIATRRIIYIGTCQVCRLAYSRADESRVTH